MSKIAEFQKKNGLVADGILGKKTFAKMKEVWKIKTDEQLAHFLGQGAHESINFTTDRENLNYSAKALIKTFKKYFTINHALEPNKAHASQYARQPQKIANKVYANRMGNGDESSGDGWRHIGAGEMQVTGADNYKAFSKWLGLDKVLTTDEIAKNYFWETGIFYFTTNNLWKLALKIDDESILTLSRAINIGNIKTKLIPNGLEDREIKTKYYYNLIKK